MTTFGLVCLAADKTRKWSHPRQIDQRPAGTSTTNHLVPRPTREPVRGQELAARFGMGDRGTAVAGPTGHLLLANLSGLTQSGQLAAEGTLQRGQFGGSGLTAAPPPSAHVKRAAQAEPS